MSLPPPGPSTNNSDSLLPPFPFDTGQTLHTHPLPSSSSAHTAQKEEEGPHTNGEAVSGEERKVAVEQLALHPPCNCVAEVVKRGRQLALEVVTWRKTPQNPQSK
eukprot:GHVT01058640.1.p1 GENE.GHVT01058640.1~~GHVT01058640.1.p1  ORF type:complete len:105 (-),score=11.64 GHVT01058640.1:77-391(-)